MIAATENRYGFRARLAASTSVLVLWAGPLAAYAAFDGPDYYEAKLLGVYSLPLLVIALITALLAGPAIAVHPWRWSFGAALLALIGMAIMYFTLIPVAVAFIAGAAVVFPLLVRLMLKVSGPAVAAP